MPRPAEALALLLSMAVATPVAAQGRTAVKPIDGYVCMSLNVETGFLYEHRDYAVPEYVAPSLSSKVVSITPNVVVVPAGPPTGGFFQVLRQDRSHAWVESKYLRPWNNPYAPKARCVPYLMSDGSIGIGP
jgi:hypothetical protein